MEIVTLIVSFLFAKKNITGKTYPSLDPQNRIELQAGQDYAIKCGMLDDNNELSFISSSAVLWYVKRASVANCGTLSSCDSSSLSSTDSRGLLDNTSSNSNINDNDWNLINCDTKPCKSILQLTNVKPDDSGYYKCVTQPFSEIQFVMTYNIIVLSKYLYIFLTQLK